MRLDAMLKYGELIIEILKLWVCRGVRNSFVNKRPVAIGWLQIIYFINFFIC